MKVRIIAKDKYEIASIIVKDSCCVELFFAELDKSFNSNIADLIVMMEHIATHGFSNIPRGWSHEIDKQEKIFELIKGRLRIPYFHGEGDQIIVCGPGFMKQKQTTSDSVKKGMKKLRDQYFKDLAAGKLGTLEQ